MPTNVNVPRVTGTAQAACNTTPPPDNVAVNPNGPNGAAGNILCTGSFTFTPTATGPAGTAVGGTPAVFIPLINVLTGTTAVNGYACSTTIPASLAVTCTGTEPTPGLLPIQGGTVTIRFPLAAGGTADVTGIITGPGAGNAPLLPPPPPIILPPPPSPLVPLPPAAPVALGEVPVIPEADSLLLLATGLAALGMLVGLRMLRRRQAIR